MIFQEHSQVVLKRTVPALKLEAGDLGVVVHVHGRGEAYEVEFLTRDGHTVSVETILQQDLRAASGKAGPHEHERIAS